MIFQDSTKALELKEIGNQYFKQQDTNQALEYYEKALELCPSLDTGLYSSVLFKTCKDILIINRENN